MDRQEALRAKAHLLREMETNIQDVMRIMHARGSPITRSAAVRIVRCGTVEQVSRLWAQESSRAPLSVAEFRALMAVFNEVMDELAQKAVS